MKTRTAAECQWVPRVRAGAWGSQAGGRDPKDSKEWTRRTLREPAGEPEGESASRTQKHESLILAQDERWRRA